MIRFREGGGGGSRRSGGGDGRGRNGGGRGGHRSHGGGGRGGHHRRRDNFRRDPREASNSGNEHERIAVESGDLVFIDQFMLANPQLLERLQNSIDEDPSVKAELIKEYGGCVVSLEPGTYKIKRDPFAFTIVVHPENKSVDTATLNEIATSNLGRVFIDTRCIAMVDRELLDDSHLLSEYQSLWFKGQEKACRDMIRDNGGAVRYGFQRFGDDLGIYVVPNEQIVCLWPDVVEGSVSTGEQSTQSEVEV